jgi:hypothetical protein
MIHKDAYGRGVKHEDMEYSCRIISRNRRIMGNRLGWDNNIKLVLTELRRKGINWGQNVKKIKWGGLPEKFLINI